jgi:hypothetical protein
VVAPVRAAYVQLSGTNFDISYDPAQSGVSAFGSPQLIGDSVIFAADNFSANSLNGGGLVSQSNAFQLLVLPHQDRRITGLQIFAFGDYLLAGQGSYVRAVGTLGASDSATAAQSSASITPTVDPIVGSTNGQFVDWQGSTTISSMTKQNAWLAASQNFSVEINSTLEAFTDPSGGNGSRAFIEEKFVVGQGTVLSVASTPEVVPEPGTASLVLSGLATLLCIPVLSRMRRAIRIASAD